MTGFALKTISITKNNVTAHLTLSIKSLNSRFLETTCKLPSVLSHIETECIKRFKEKLHRGYIVFSIHISNQSLFKGSVQAEITIANSYLTAVADIQQQCAVPGTITISDMIALPAIFSMEEHTIDDHDKKIILTTIDELLEDLNKSRKTEGIALKKDLEQRCSTISHEMSIIEREAQRCMAEKKAKILERLSHLDNQSPEIRESQRNTLYFELDKIDIHEEIIRFNSHLKTFLTHLNAADVEKGRRLDFTLQELAREVNTIAAKCSDAIISEHAINIKVELEKAREQVQNIV